MIGLLQRVNKANVEVDGKIIAAIERGLLVFIAVQKHDTEAQAGRLMERLLGYRVFNDEAGKMNLSVKDIDGGLLLVPQFTLAADNQKGMRPSFSSAAAPQEGQRLFGYLISLAKQQFQNVATGEFGADMQVSLINDGPVTFWLEVK